MIDPNKDGIDHINVYSKGKTELGKLLSNFAHTPFFVLLEENGESYDVEFQSVEGYWYYLLTGDENLLDLHGFKAKEYGKSLLNEDTKENVAKDELKLAYEAKLAYHSKIKEMLLKNELPLKHYYVYGGKVVEPKQFQWTVDLWNEIKQELKNK